MLHNLEGFYCYDNVALTSLNIKNNNNSALLWRYVYNNLMLSCI